MFFGEERSSFDFVVMVADDNDMDAYEREIRQIFMGAFGVPLSAVSTAEAGTLRFVVHVDNVNADDISQAIHMAAIDVARSTILPPGSRVTTGDPPKIRCF